MPVGGGRNISTASAAVGRGREAAGGRGPARRRASSPLAGRGASSSIFTASAAIVPVAVVRGEILTTVDFPPASEKLPR